MKKAVLTAAALTMVLALAACGNMDKNNSSNGTALGDANGTNGVSGTTDGYGTNGVNGMNDVNGADGVNGSITRSNWNGAAANGSTASSRSTAGGDLRRAADDVGSAVTRLAEDGRDMVARGTGATSFERMLDNARVHDRDGVLTDGENSRW